MIYVYAIVDAPPPSLRGMCGLAGAALEGVAAGEVAAVCSAHQTLDLRADAETMWVHEGVTSGLLGATSVVPVRFGTVLATRDEVVSLLEEGADRYRAMLARLRGRVELSLRARVEVAGEVGAAGAGGGDGAGGAPRGGAGPGAAYLRARRPAPFPAPLQDLHDTLAARSAASTLRSAAGEMVAAYLADAGDVGWFRSAVARAATAGAGVSTRLTGPWAPFTFTEVGAHAR